MPLIPVLQRQKQADVEASLVYTVSSKTAGATLKAHRGFVLILFVVAVCLFVFLFI